MYKIFLDYCINYKLFDNLIEQTAALASQHTIRFLHLNVNNTLLLHNTLLKLQVLIMYYVLNIYKRRKGNKKI